VKKVPENQVVPGIFIPPQLQNNNTIYHSKIKKGKEKINGREKKSLYICIVMHVRLNKHENFTNQSGLAIENTNFM